MLAWAVAIALFAHSAEAQWHLGPPELVIGKESGVYFEEIADIFVREDRAYVTDQRAAKLYAFDRDTGEVVAVAGRRGEGPGEFRFLDRIDDCDGNTIVASDLGLGRVSVFSLDLEHLRTFALALDEASLAAIQCVGSNGFVGIKRNSDPLLGLGRAIPMEPFLVTVDVVLLAPNGSLRRVIGQFPGEDRFREARQDGRGYSTYPHVWGRRPVFDSSQRGFVFGTGDAWSLTRYDAEGNVLDTLALDESRLAVARDQVDQYVRWRVAASRNPQRARRFWAEYPFPSHFPAYSAVVASEHGFTWVEYFSAPYPEPSPHWKVFGPDGALAAVADLPRGFELMWVGNTHVAGVVKDELDVPSVEVRPILPRHRGPRSYHDNAKPQVGRTTGVQGSLSVAGFRNNRGRSQLSTVGRSAHDMCRTDNPKGQQRSLGRFQIPLRHFCCSTGETRCDSSSSRPGAVACSRARFRSSRYSRRGVQWTGSGRSCETLPSSVRVRARGQHEKVGRPRGGTRRTCQSTEYCVGAR